MEINQTEITHVAQTTETAPAPAPTPAMSLLSLLEGFLAGYIQTAVDKRVAEIMQCKENLNTIDEALETRIREIACDVAEEYIDDAITSHERNESHHSEDDIEHTVSSYLDNYDFSNIVHDAVQDAVHDAIDDIDFDDKISDAIDNIDLDDKINTSVASALNSATIKLEV